MGKLVFYASQPVRLYQGKGGKGKGRDKNKETAGNTTMKCMTKEAQEVLFLKNIVHTCVNPGYFFSISSSCWSDLTRTTFSGSVLIQIR